MGARGRLGQPTLPSGMKSQKSFRYWHDTATAEQPLNSDGLSDTE
jgi:hypothetical protein